MKKTILLLLLNIILFGINAQNIAELENQADEWSKKSYSQTKALSSYLLCLKQTQNKETQMRIMDKTTSIIENRRILHNNDAVIIDSIIDEARIKYGNDIKYYLPLIEQRIMKSSSSAEKYMQEFKLYDEAISIRRTNNILHGEDYEQLLRWYVSKLTYKKDMSKKDKLESYANLWNVYMENNPNLDSLDTKLLDSYTLQCSLGKDYQTSANLHELKKQYIEKTEGKNCENYLNVLQKLCWDYSNIYDENNPRGVFRMTSEKEKELSYRLELLQLQKNNGIEIKGDDIKSLLFNLITYKNDTITARDIANGFASMTEQKYNKESVEYCKALDLVVDTYDRDDAEVIPLLRELLELQEKVLGKDDISYKSTYNSLSYALSQNHHMQEAINMQTNVTKQNNYTDLVLLSSQQSQYGLYREAISTYEQMMEYCASYPQERSMHLLSATLGTINCYIKLKDIDGLLGFGKKWCNDNRFTFDEQYFIYSNVISQAGLHGNDYNNVILLIDEFIVSHPTAISTAVRRAEILEQKAIVYIGMKEPKQAEKVIRQIINSLKKEQADSRLIIKYEQYLEICLMAQENWDEAIEENQRVLSKMSQLPGYKKYIEYLTLCCRTAIYQNKKNNFDEVLRLCELIDSYDVLQAESLFSDNSYSINTFTVLTTFLGSSSVELPRYRALCKKGLYDVAEERMNKDAVDKESLLRFSLSRLDNNIQNSTTTWTREFNDIINNVAISVMSDSISIKAFDYALLYKQAFLTAETSMRHQLLESGNDNVKAKFKELQDLRIAIQQYEAAGLPTKELTERSMQLDRQLVEDSKMYGDFTKTLNLTWIDIRNCLQSCDMVVEFVSYISFDDNKEHIAALVLRNDWKAPKVIHLFSTEQIPESVYDDTTFSEMCWGPILQYSKDIKNIYFAPAGILYNIGIESLLIQKNQEYIANKYNVYRISSSREMFNLGRASKDDLYAAVIYGGLNFDASITEIVDNTQNNDTHSTKSSDSLLLNLRSAIKTIPYLPGTKKEAEIIADIIRSNGNNINANLLTGISGTEYSFKAMDGQNINIIHISTHGFYDVGNKNNQNQSNFYLLQKDTEDKILTRTGLFFAGATNAIVGDSIPEGLDDGILTAQEVSTLDLRGLDMVSLSACQTAQGFVLSDGVFGLQRGFKIAGAKSILMSLWNVEDNATCLLMTEFYKNWIGNNMTKYDALEEAKKTVRSHNEKGWDDPQYWAAFILLDGLD